MAARRKVSEKALDAAWTEYANWMDSADVRALFRVGGGDWSLLPKSTLRLVEMCRLDASEIREDCRTQIERRSRWGTNTLGEVSYKGLVAWLAGYNAAREMALAGSITPDLRVV